MDILAQCIESTENDDGEIPAGFLFASIKNVGTSSSQVNGVPLPPGEAKSYPFIGKGYQAISFTVNGSTLRVMRVI